MAEEVVASPEPLIDTDSAVSPAPAAEDQKAIPAATDENAEAVAETPEQQEAKRQSRTQRRFERQKTARIQAETEARLLREQNAKLEQQLRSKPPESGEPQRDQFEDYESYLRAVTKYDAKQEAAATLKARDEENRGREQQGRAAAVDEKVAKAWVDRENAFKATAPDYEEVVGAYVEDGIGDLSDGARRLIVDSDKGPQLLDHLARHSDVADRISALPPHRQLAELGKLEAAIAAPPSKKASDAPPPIKPVGQGRSAANGYSDNMSDTEYREWRKGQGARWAR